MVEVMSPRDGLTKFFQHGLQVFLRRLLAMETLLVMKRLASAGHCGGEPIVVLGLSRPFPRGPFHTIPYLWSRSPYGRIHGRPAAIADFSGCEPGRSIGNGTGISNRIFTA